VVHDEVDQSSANGTAAICPIFLENMRLMHMGSEIRQLCGVSAEETGEGESGQRGLLLGDRIDEAVIADLCIE
jgi:hypothetical protein